MLKRFSNCTAILAVIGISATPALCGHAQNTQSAAQLRTVSVDSDGTVHIPGYALPVSIYMSEESKRAYIALRLKWPDVKLSSDVSTNRKSIDTWLMPQLERIKTVFQTAVESYAIGGVRTDVVVPKDGVAKCNEDRVLISLHGGGFLLGSGTLQLIEAIPVSATAKIKVISVDFRQAPEYKFPAASEDVTQVYKELLKSYRPENIGIYGNSSGSALVAMSLAWFQKEKLPPPGAVGMFFAHSGTGLEDGGDSLYTAAPLYPLFNSRQAPPPIERGSASLLPYLSQVDASDPLVDPLLHPDVFAKFPPTLVVSSTRDTLASKAIHTHRRLARSGVESQLELWEGMWSTFHQDVDLPESKELYDVVAEFFAAHLGTRGNQRFRDAQPTTCSSASP